jgi:hypothetical protein
MLEIHRREIKMVEHNLGQNLKIEPEIEIEGGTTGQTVSEQEIKKQVERTIAQATSTEIIHHLIRQPGLEWIDDSNDSAQHRGDETDDSFNVDEEYDLNDWDGIGEWENSGVARANHFGGLETDGYLPHPDLVLSRINGEIEVEVPLAEMLHQWAVNDRYGRGTTQRLYASCYLEALKNRVALLYDLGELICKPQNDEFFNAESWDAAEKQLNKTFQKSKVAKQLERNRADFGKLIDHLWVQFEPYGVVIPLGPLFPDSRSKAKKLTVSDKVLYQIISDEDPEEPLSSKRIAEILQDPPYDCQVTGKAVSNRLSKLKDPAIPSDSRERKRRYREWSHWWDNRYLREMLVAATKSEEHQHPHPIESILEVLQDEYDQTINDFDVLASWLERLNIFNDHNSAKGGSNTKETHVY